MKYLSFLFVFSFFTSCSEKSERLNICEYNTAISTAKYTDGPFDSSTKINSIEWNGECLEISISYSGGCEDHVFEVVRHETVLYSNPPIFQMAIVHDNQDLCQAYPTVVLEVSLDEIADLEDSDKIILSFQNPSFNYTLKK